jgi:glutamine cyclotransferase
VVRAFPHDPAAFTQGLLYEGGHLYESTGQYGQSSLRQVELETGQVLRQVKLEERFWGEGLTLFHNRLIQLTWLSKQALVYDLETFKPLAHFAYSTEGWGLTHDGERLVMSDGTAILYWRDPFTFAEIGRLVVQSDEGPVAYLNELEWVEGQVYANVWQTDRIARIDPATGRVIGWIDLSGLLGEEDRKGRQVDVLNGIAYDSQNQRLLVTGKRWPKVFQIELVPVEK